MLKQASSKVGRRVLLIIHGKKAKLTSTIYINLMQHSQLHLAFNYTRCDRAREASIVLVVSLLGRRSNNFYVTTLNCQV